MIEGTEAIAQETQEREASMQKTVIDTRLAVQRLGDKPNTYTGNEAWDVAVSEYPELTDKDKSAFVREWYAGITRSQKAEVEKAKSASRSGRANGRTPRGFDKNGEPTNAARATRMENHVTLMWDALLKYAATKTKKINKAVNERHQAALARVEEQRVAGEKEKAEIDAKRAERKAKKEAEA